MDKANYKKIVLNSGEIFEMFGTYFEPYDKIINPPDMLSTREQNTILKIMKKNNIKKLEVIN